MRMDQGRRNHPPGQAMVESIFAFLLLFTLLLGAAEFGKVFYLYNQLLISAQRGARYLATHPVTALTPVNVVNRNATNLVVYGRINPGQNAAPLLPGLRVANVTIERDPNPDVPNFITVRIRYRIKPLPLIDVLGEGYGEDYDIYPEVTFRYLQPNS